MQCGSSQEARALCVVVVLSLSAEREVVEVQSHARDHEKAFTSEIVRRRVLVFESTGSPLIVDGRVILDVLDVVHARAEHEPIVV